MLRMAKGFILVSMLLPSMGYAGDKLAAQLDAVLARWTNSDKVSSVVVSVQQGDQLLYSGASGYRSVEKVHQAKEQDYFRTASVGKLFTAAAILRLAEKGLLSVDDPITKYLTQDMVNAVYGSLGSSVTISQLLSHSSGLNNIDDDPAKDEWLVSSPSQYKSPIEILEHSSSMSLVYQPGKGQIYTSAGYILLGMIIESATKQRYHEVIRQEILTPLQLNSTYEHTFEWNNRAPLLHAYAGTFDMNTIHPSMEFADGGFVTTASDLTKFGLALADGKLFELSSTLELMLSPQGDEGIGLGPFIGETPSGDLDFYHPGYWGVMLYVIPEQNLAIAYTVNQSEVDYSKLLDQILTILD